MNVFVKSNSASIISSFCDYLISILLKELLGVPAVIASLIGTIAGGISNFFINRHWVFKVKSSSIYFQTKRYFLIWLGNLLLNVTGVYLLIEYGGLYYIIAKLITSAAVAVFYNYPLQKNFVFKNNE